MHNAVFLFVFQIWVNGDHFDNAKKENTFSVQLCLLTFTQPIQPKTLILSVLLIREAVINDVNLFETNLSLNQFEW